MSDKHLPSVVRLTGGEVKGSWWAHKKGRTIFRALSLLEGHPDVLVTRLVSGKVTYIHRRLWQDFMSVATGNERWQRKGLTAQARRLMAAVEKQGEIRMDQYAGERQKELRTAAHQVEERLLAYTDEIHTEKGSHSKVLMTWSRCPKLTGWRFTPKSPASARESLEGLLDGLKAEYGGDAELPWRKAI